MEKNQKNKNQRNPKLSRMTLILRTLVAGYLLYTVYQLTTSLSELSGKDLWIVMAAIVIFVLIALPLGIMSLMDLLKKNYVENGQNFKEVQTEETVIGETFEKEE